MDQASMSESQVSALTPADFDQIREDFADFWGDTHLRFLHHPMFLHEFGDSAFVIREGSRVVAYLLGFTTYAGVAYVHMIGVRRSHQRRGLGHLLYECFTELATKRGCTEMRAITSADNTQSIDFHRQIGMELVGEPRTPGGVPVVWDYGGPGEDRVVFKKILR
jgi:GNAT superfamily N-acetyltransferase